MQIGSPFLEAFLTKHAQTLACDFVLSADGGQLSETQPSITLGLREVPAGGAGSSCGGGGGGSGGCSAATIAASHPAVLGLEQAAA